MRNNSTHHCDGGCRVSTLLILLGSAVVVAGQQSGDPTGTLLFPSQARDTAVSTVARIATLKDGGDAAVAHKRQRRGSTRYQYQTCFANCQIETVQGFFGTFERTTCDADCRCNEGLYLTLINICYHCHGGSYKPTIGNDRSCTPHPNCQPGQYRSGATSRTERATCYRCRQGHYSTAWNANACTPCRNCKETQIAIGECAGTADTQCEECDNAVCRENEYRSGSCNSDGAGFTCSTCDNFDCTSQSDRASQGKHMYRAGTCGGQATPTVNGYTCDKHEPCPDIDTFYLPSDDTQRTCPDCPAGQHQPVANHRELECIDTTTSTTTATTTTTSITIISTTTVFATSTKSTATTTATSSTTTTTTASTTTTTYTGSTTVSITTSSATTATPNATDIANQESKAKKTKTTTFVVVVVVILLLTVIGLIAHAKWKRQRRQHEQADPLGPRAMRATTVANAGFQGMPAPALALEEPYGAHCDDAGASDDGIGDGKCDGHGDGDGYIHVEGASSANAHVTESLRRVQQQHVPYGGAEGHVRWGAMQQSASAPRLINDAGVYLQSSSEQAMLYDTGDVPGIAGNQLPVYADVDDAQDPDRGAAQVNATMQRCKYRQAGAGGQRCKAKTSTEWCEKHTCSTPACKNSKSSKDVVCVRCPERAEAGGVMYAARNDGTLRIGADGGMFYATRNDGNRPSTGANAAGGGIKRSGNRKGSVYLGFEEGGETSTL